MQSANVPNVVFSKRWSALRTSHSSDTSHSRCVQKGETTAQYIEIEWSHTKNERSTSQAHICCDQVVSRAPTPTSKHTNTLAPSSKPSSGLHSVAFAMAQTPSPLCNTDQVECSLARTGAILRTAHSSAHRHSASREAVSPGVSYSHFVPIY